MIVEEDDVSLESENDTMQKYHLKVGPLLSIIHKQIQNGLVHSHHPQSGFP